MSEFRKSRNRVIVFLAQAGFRPSEIERMRLSDFLCELRPVEEVELSFKGKKERRLARDKSRADMAQLDPQPEQPLTTKQPYGRGLTARQIRRVIKKALNGS